MKYLYVVSLLTFASCSPSSEDTGVTENESTGNWSMVQTENTPTPRHENAFTESGGKFYLIGGRGIKPVDIYDPETRTWTEGETPPLEMHHFQALPYKGKIYVLGALTGGYPDEKPIPDIYIYDPEADSWTKGDPIPEGRRRGAAGVVVKDDQFYLVNGIQRGHLGDYTNWLDVYNPETGEWKQLATSPNKRDHFQAAIVGGKLYAAGGRTSSAATEQTMELTVPKMDIYDFATDSWISAEEPIPTERAGTSAVVMGDDLIIIGGESVAHEVAHDEVEVWHTDTQTWDSLPFLQMGRHATQAFIFEDKIYIGAGSKNAGGGPELDNLEVFE